MIVIPANWPELDRLVKLISPARTGGTPIRAQYKPNANETVK